MSRSKTLRLLTMGIIVLAVALVGWQSWKASQTSLPDGIVYGNGRIEAVQVDVATKYAGKIESILVEEGDMVERGTVVAYMDSTELDAQLAEARARLAQAEESRAEAAAAIVQQQSALTLAEQELNRILPLAERGSVAQRQAEEAQSAFDSAQAALEVVQARARTAERAVEAARAAVTRVEAQVAECELKSAVTGRVLYRLAEPGEMLAAGGKALTILDLSDIYMEIFLHAQYASRLPIGAEARIKLDVVDFCIPATVSFVSPEAQFTPKQVETPSEREKLMFRVKVRIPQELVVAHMEKVKTGVRGVAYIRLDPPPGQEPPEWPDFLQQLPPDYGPEAGNGNSSG
ncbi:MAG: HlyD family secretion protein [Phycisphaerales bacterium JB065]